MSLFAVARNRPPNCRTENSHLIGASILQNSLSVVAWTDFGEVNPRNFRHKFGEQNVSGNTRDYVAERVGFEPTVRLPVQRFSSSKILMLARAVP
jgi:hypothetical protein